MATKTFEDAEPIERAAKVGAELMKNSPVPGVSQESIVRRGRKRLIGLMGKLVWDEGFDVKTERLRK
jgi:hypothetical protein